MKHVLTIFICYCFCFHLDAQSKTEEKFVDSRDSNSYAFIALNNLYWFTENLRFESPQSVLILPDSSDGSNACGRFYPIAESQSVCPSNWRLPTKKEIQHLIKRAKKLKFSISDRLTIDLCGRIDYDKHAKSGLQNTFWLSEPLEDGHTMHWHTFGETQELHSHDVINARRKFPIRCVQNISSKQ